MQKQNGWVEKKTKRVKQDVVVKRGGGWSDLYVQSAGRLGAFLVDLCGMLKDQENPIPS